MKSNLLVVYLFYNEVHVLSSPNESWQAQAPFSHPRSLLGKMPLLQQTLQPLMAEYVATQNWWQRRVGAVELVWVLPHQEGGLHFLELRALKELSLTLFSKSVYVYATESDTLNYLVWQEKIATLERI